LFRFCGWLLDEGKIDAHPMLKLAPPEPKAKQVPVLTDEDLTGLLKACGGKEFHDRRDDAMIRLLLDCGLRVSELCGVDRRRPRPRPGDGAGQGQGQQDPPGLLRRPHHPRRRPLHELTA
jgi:site-specific recombinase XerC